MAGRRREDRQRGQSQKLPVWPGTHSLKSTPTRIDIGIHNPVHIQHFFLIRYQGSSSVQSSVIPAMQNEYIGEPFFSPFLFSGRESSVVLDPVIA